MYSSPLPERHNVVRSQVCHFIMELMSGEHYITNDSRFLLVNNQLEEKFFFIYVQFYSLHVSGSHAPIIRRINCINTTSGICHSV
jgi:hypothetical protein